MKEAFWSYLLISLGMFIIVVLILVQNLTSTSEEDYYLVKEVMEAAMIDSVDYSTYRTTGEIRIITEKFVEVFTRRFAESVSPSKNYVLEFYEIYETPPKATVKIKTKTGEYSITTEDTVDLDIITTLSGILETKYNESKCPQGYCIK